MPTPLSANHLFVFFSAAWSFRDSEVIGFIHLFMYGPNKTNFFVSKYYVSVSRSHRQNIEVAEFKLRNYCVYFVTTTGDHNEYISQFKAE